MGQLNLFFHWEDWGPEKPGICPNLGFVQGSADGELSGLGMGPDCLILHHGSLFTLLTANSCKLRPMPWPESQSARDCHWLCPNSNHLNLLSSLWETALLWLRKPQGWDPRPGLSWGWAVTWPSQGFRLDSTEPAESSCLPWRHHHPPHRQGETYGMAGLDGVLEIMRSWFSQNFVFIPVGGF